MADIFISYRRDDARADAGRLHDRLCQKFGDERVFMDVDDISPGADFVELLHSTLSGCGAIVVVIGRDWIGQNAQTGEARLSSAEDFVHIEVRTALERGIPVIPVLVGGASMPAKEQLPEPLWPLLSRQAIELRHTRFNDDADQLIKALSAAVADRPHKPSRRTAILAIAGVTVALAGFSLWRLVFDQAVIQLRSEPVMLSVNAAKEMLTRLNFYHARWNPDGLPPDGPLEQLLVADHLVINDHATGLMWQAGSMGRPQAHAKTQSSLQQLNSESYAGYSDWRLPTVEEAMSLMQSDATTDYHLAPVFDARAAPFIWTADRAGEKSGWVVYFYDGFCMPEHLEFNASVRAVRGNGL